MKAFILLFLLLFSVLTPHAQTFGWKWVSGASVPLLSSGTSQTNAVCHSKDSNYVYFGGQASGNSLAVVGPLLSVVLGNGQDAFLAKYTSSGTLVWMISFGSTGTEEISAIDVDAYGNVFVGGSFTSATSVVGKNGVSVALNTPSGGGKSDVFVAKFDSNGNLLWAETGRSSGEDYIHDLEVYNDIVYIAGEYENNFQVGPTGSPTTVSGSGDSDAFGLSLFSDGSLNWIRAARSNDEDAYQSVTVMSTGVYFGGYFSGTSLNFLGAAVAATINSNNGTDEGLLARYGFSGNYVTHQIISGNGNARVNGLCNNGTDLFYTGYFKDSTTFPGNSGINNNNTQSYTVKCNTSFQTTWFQNSIFANNARGMSISAIGTSALVGVTTYSGSFFPFTQQGGQDILIYVLSQSSGNTLSVKANGGPGDDIPFSVTSKNINEIFVGGQYGTSCNFNPLPDLTSNSSKNAFWGMYGCTSTATATLSGNDTICLGDTAKLNLTFTGTGPFSITLSNGTTDSMITGISTLNYVVNLFPNSTTSYSLVDFSANGCTASFSGSGRVEVFQPISNNLILSSNSICIPAGGSATLDGNIPSGGGGGYTYQWQFSQNGSPYANVTFQTLEDMVAYGPPFNVVVTKYLRIAKTNYCPADSSGIVLVDVPMTGNTITTPSQTLCSGSNVVLNATVPTNGASGSYAYQWETSPDNINWSSFSVLGTGQNETVTNITTTTFFRRLAKSGECGYAPSASIKITLENPIGQNTISVLTDKVCAGSFADSILGQTPINGSGAPIYQWQKKTLAGTWINAGGASQNSKSYAPGILTETTIFKRIVSGSVCGISESNFDTIFVQSPLANFAITTPDQHICASTNPASIMAQLPTGGVQPYTYIWEKSSLSNPIWTTVVADSLVLVPSILTETTTFRRKVANSGVCPNQISNLHTVLIDSEIVNYNLISSDFLCFSNPTILDGLVPSGGNGIFTYQWQYKPNSSPIWLDVTFGTSEDYVLNSLSTVTSFRRKVGSGLCTAQLSDTVIVDIPIANNVINDDQIVCSTNTPDSLTGPVPTTGAIVFYEWEQSLDGINWDTITAAPNLGANLVLPNLGASTYYRRLVKTRGCGVNASNSVLISVELPITQDTITSTSQTICSGTAPDSILGSQPQNGSGPGTYVYIWQKKPIGSSFPWTNISGATSPSLFPGNMTQSLVFRRLVVGGVCDTSASNTDTIYVQNPIAGNTLLSSNQSICSIALPDTILGALPTGGSGSYTYVWQDSSATNTWSNASGNTADSIHYFPGSISESTFYRRIVEDPICGNDTSTFLSISVDFPILLNAIAGDTTICYQTQPDTIFGSASANGYGFVWEQSLDTNNLNSWTLIPGITSQNYGSTLLTQSIFYRRIAEGGFCLDDTSNVVTIQVTTPISANFVSADTTVCYGLDSLVLSGSVLLGGVGNNTFEWQSSLDNVTFQNASGTNSQINYVTGTVTEPNYYRRRAVNNACPTQDSMSNVIFIDVFDRPTIAFDFSQDSICNGDSISIALSLSGDAPFSIFATYDASPFNLTGITGTHYNVDFLPSVSSSLTIDSITDINGCTESIAELFTIRIIAMPQTNLTKDSVLCDSTFLFNPVLSVGQASLTSPTFGNLSSIFPYSFTTPLFGQHDFILTETNEVCVDADTVSITFYQEIGAISAGEDQTLHQLLEANLSASPLVGLQTGTWTALTSEATFSNNENPSSMVFDLAGGANYLIWTVNSGTCPVKRDTVKIFIHELFIPTGFSPNGDGDNDVFFIDGTGKYDVIKLQIFNRWGNEVFVSKDYKNDWDGKLNSGEDLPEDTYFYILDLSPEEMYKGYLVLKR